MRLQPADAPRVFREIEAIKKNFRTLETLGKPVVSCLNGTRAGRRLGARAGGPLPRRRRRSQDPVRPARSHAGPDARRVGHHQDDAPARPDGRAALLLEGKLFGPREALELGLVHELVADAADLRAGGAGLDRQQQRRGAGTSPGTTRTTRCPAARPATRKIAGMLAVAPAMLKQQDARPVPGARGDPGLRWSKARRSTSTPRCASSRRYLAKLIVGPVAKNMINTFFFNLNAIKSRPVAAQGRAALQAEARSACWAPGMMGGGIAYVQASRGIATVLKDVTPGEGRGGQGLQRARSRSRASTKGRMNAQEQAALLERITPPTRSQDAARLRPDHRGGVREPRAEGPGHAGSRADARARRLLRQQHLHAADHRPGQGQRRPEKFIGIHFFSPVDKMKLVEIIRGKQTDDETVARAFDYVQSIGKIPIVVNDSRGFFTSPRVRHLRDGRRGDGRRRHPRRGRWNRPASRPACRSGRWRCSTKPRCRCRCT